MKEEINIENDILYVNKFLTYENAKQVQHQAFYWDWPLETGSTDEEIYQNNIED